MLITLAAVVVIAGIVGAVLLNQVHYTVLYSGLDASEAGTIKTLLDGKGVQSKVQGTSTILVPKDQADTLRIELASEGYPSSGLNYDIFSGSSALGSTDLERKTLLQYQLQENMRSTIKLMDKVQDCIVIVNLASNSSFVVSDNTTQASVAVMLNLKNGQTLSNAEAKTIGEFVMKCVPELKAENVSIVDSKMNYYNILSDSGNADASEYSASQQQMTEQMKDILSQQVLKVLEPAIGNGNVAVSVNLNLDFDKQMVNKVEFSPPIDGESSGLVRSSEELYNAVGAGTGASGTAGTESNGTGTPAYVSGAASPSGAETNSTKTYNYELNEIQTQIEKAQGAIQNLSVAVLVNSKVNGADAHVDTIKNLVAKSIGVKSDYISVELMPFVSNSNLDSVFEKNQQTVNTLSRNKTIVNIVEIAAILAGAIIIIRLFRKKPASIIPAPTAATAMGTYDVRLTAGETLPEQTVEDINMADLVMKKSSEAEKIEELMDRYPETVAQILRTWLAEEY